MILPHRPRVAETAVYNQGTAADLLGISRNTLKKYMLEFGQSYTVCPIGKRLLVTGKSILTIWYRYHDGKL